MRTLLLLTVFAAAIPAQSTFTGPVTGQAVPSMAVLDQTMESLLTTYQIPGAALAVSYKGALVYARGFGYADTASSSPVEPDSLFRTASVSKIFTAATVLKLIELGKLQPDQPAFALLSDLQPAPGRILNPGLAAITIRELLNHTSGLIDNAGTIGPDPMQDTVAVATAMNAPSPANCDTVIRYELSQPLQNQPGTTYAYSNVGYCALDAIIRRVTGLGYEQAVRQYVLTPLNIGRAKLADPLLSDKLNGEVTYYDYPGAPLGEDIFNPSGAKVSATYGGPETNFLAKEATGGWVTTTIDLLRFINGLDGLRGGPLFAPSTIQLMQTEDPAFGNAAGYYGIGMEIDRVSTGFDWWKTGGYSGTAAEVFRYAGGVAFAVIFNSSPNTTFSYESPIEAALSKVAFNLPDQLANFTSTLKPPVLSLANPVISGATFEPGIVSGSWLSITGSNLATATRIWRADEFLGDDFSQLPLDVDGVSVTIDGKPAPVYYVSPTQLNVQAPTDAATGPVSVVVTHDGQTSVAPVEATLDTNAPGFFAYASGSSLFASAIHLNGGLVGDPSVVPGASAAQPNETIAIFGTGFAPSPAGTVNVPVSALNPAPTVTIGGTPATVTFGGITGPGLYQVNLVVPNLSPGVYPVKVSVNGVASLSTPGLFIGPN